MELVDCAVLVQDVLGYSRAVAADVWHKELSSRIRDGHRESRVHRKQSGTVCASRCWLCRIMLRLFGFS